MPATTAFPTKQAMYCLKPILARYSTICPSPPANSIRPASAVQFPRELRELAMFAIRQMCSATPRHLLPRAASTNAVSSKKISLRGDFCLSQNLYESLGQAFSKRQRQLMLTSQFPKTESLVDLRRGRNPLNAFQNAGKGEFSA